MPRELIQVGFYNNYIWLKMNLLFYNTIMDLWCTCIHTVLPLASLHLHQPTFSFLWPFCICAASQHLVPQLKCSLHRISWASASPYGTCMLLTWTSTVSHSMTWPMHLGVLMANVTVAKQCDHITLCFTTKLISNSNPDPKCHNNPRTTCMYLFFYYMYYIVTPDTFW